MLKYFSQGKQKLLVVLPCLERESLTQVLDVWEKDAFATSTLLSFNFQRTFHQNRLCRELTPHWHSLVFILHSVPSFFSGQAIPNCVCSRHIDAHSRVGTFIPDLFPELQTYFCVCLLNVFYPTGACSSAYSRSNQSILSITGSSLLRLLHPFLYFGEPHGHLSDCSGWKPWCPPPPPFPNCHQGPSSCTLACLTLPSLFLHLTVTALVQAFSSSHPHWETAF